MWALWCLAALSPSLLIVACACLSRVLDRRRREPSPHHPSVMGRERRIIRELEREFSERAS